MTLKDTIVEGYLEGKAKDVICLDLRNIDGAVSDFFIVAHGDSATHVEGINRSIYKKCVKALNEKPWKTNPKLYNTLSVKEQPCFLPMNYEWVMVGDENIQTKKSIRVKCGETLSIN